MFSSPRSINNIKKISYSELLSHIKQGRVESIILSPENRHVKVKFKNGTVSKVSVFYNDQTLLRTIELSNTPLEVVNSDQNKTSQIFVAYSTIAIFFTIILKSQEF